jgi:hypothetical protein
MGGTTLDVSELVSFLQVAAKVPAESMGDAVLAVDEAVKTWKRQASARTPVGVSGDLARTFSTNVVKGQRAIKGELTNPMIYALPIEKGRRSRKMPPPDHLELWVRRVLGLSDDKEVRSVAFLVARAIGKRGGFHPDFRVGPKGARMVEKGLSAAEPTIQRLFDGVADGAIEKWSKS